MGVKWTPALKPKDASLPQIFWSNGMPWREANLWFHTRATTRDITARTVHTEAASILAYAKWLDSTGSKWWDFPTRKSDRCLVRFRGALIDLRDEGVLAPSTATQRMRTVIAFYRWLRASGLLSTDTEIWRDRRLGIRIPDAFGFERTMFVNSSDLAIPNRSHPTTRLEDGLFPLTTVERDALLGLVRSHCTEELFLILATAFFTGMRLQTIADLRVDTLRNALPDNASPDLYRLRIGPGARPPVATKFGVTGSVWITRSLLERLRLYAETARRLRRSRISASDDSSLLFLTRFGKSYARRGSDKSPAVNVELHSLRRLARRFGHDGLSTFRFHQARCTYASELAKLAIQAGGSIHAVAIVKDALLHRHEATTLRYIRFVEQIPIRAHAADTFTRAFLGLMTGDD